MCQRFGVTIFPSVVVISDEENHKGVRFEGTLNRDSLEKFLNQYAYSVKKKEEIISVKELTHDVYAKQRLCSESDNKNICLIYYSDNENLTGEENLILENLAKKYSKDPIKVFYILKNKYKNLYVSFYKEDEDSKFIVLRGHRKRYMAVKDGDLSELENKIDNILSGSGNMKRVVKKLMFLNSPSEKDEI